MSAKWLRFKPEVLYSVAAQSLHPQLHTELTTAIAQELPAAMAAAGLPYDMVANQVPALLQHLVPAVARRVAQPLATQLTRDIYQNQLALCGHEGAAIVQSVGTAAITGAMQSAAPPQPAPVAAPVMVAATPQVLPGSTGTEAPPSLSDM